MSVLAASPYNYVYDSLVKVRISAINSFGTSPVSVINSTGANTRRVPDKMTVITVTSKTENQINIAWTVLTGIQTGNSVILGYTLYFDNASGTTNIKLTDTLLTTYNVGGLTGGLNYKFKISARNIYGDGLFSDEVTVQASDLPDQPDIPVVSISGTKV